MVPPETSCSPYVEAYKGFASLCRSSMELFLELGVRSCPSGDLEELETAS